MLDGKIVILGFLRWEMTNDTTGEVMRGLSVKYFNPALKNNTVNARGVDICKSSSPLEMLPVFKGIDFPCLATPVYDMKANRKTQKPELYLKSVKDLSPLTF